MNIDLFDSGFDPQSYVQNLQNYRSFVKDLVRDAHADQEHVHALREAAAQHAQPVRATIMTEDWCGDSACNTPILVSLFEEAGVELRILRSSEHPSLKAYIESEGGPHPASDHIPAISIWDGNFNEIVRWIEAPAAVNAKKAEWKSGHPNFMELYNKRNDDPEAGKEFARLYRDLLNKMGGWYRDGLWKETTREIVEAMRAAPTPAPVK